MYTKNKLQIFLLIAAVMLFFSVTPGGVVNITSSLDGLLFGQTDMDRIKDIRTVLDLAEEAAAKGFNILPVERKMFSLFVTSAKGQFITQVPAPLYGFTNERSVKVDVILPAGITKEKAEVFIWKNSEEISVPGKLDIFKKASSELVLTQGINYICILVKSDGANWGRSKVIRIEAPNGEPKKAMIVVPPKKGGVLDLVDDRNDPDGFQRYLDGDEHHYKTQINEQVEFRVWDKLKQPIPNTIIAISSATKAVVIGTTLADGSYVFFPGEFAREYKNYNAIATYMGKNKAVAFERSRKKIDVVFDDIVRPSFTDKPVDLLYIIDTTGSMGDKMGGLRGLQNFIDVLQKDSVSKAVFSKIRCGLILFKDKSDEYVTKVTPFTTDMAAFKKVLDEVHVNGGGDMPEDLQSALTDAMKKMEWNKNGIRLAFVVTDAPPHLDYGQAYTYVDAIKDSKTVGVRLYSIGTSGITGDGEVVLRQIAYYTGGKYVRYSSTARTEEKWGDIIAQLVVDQLKFVLPK